MRIFIAIIFKYLFRFTYFKNKYFGFYKRIFKPLDLFRNVVRTVDFKGLQLQLRIDDWLQQNIYFLGEYEEAELKTLNQFLEEESSFIDVGANLGLFSLCASKIITKKGEIISFEPFKESYEALCNNLKMNGITNVKAENVAVTKNNCMVPLYYNDKEKNLGMVSTIVMADNSFQKVEGVSLDSYFEKNPIKRIDFIKIDIEGAEFTALEGMKAVLQKFQPILLIEILEVDKQKLILEYLTALGYNRYYISDDGTLSFTENNIERFNYIFSVNPHLIA